MADTNDKKDPFKERRKYLRIYRNFILSYQEKGEPFVKDNPSQVNNVSKGGVSFSSGHPVEQGVVLTVDLKTPFIADAIHLEGVVLECREKIAGVIYEVRIEFQEVPEQALAVLKKIEDYAKAQEEGI